MVTVDQDLLGLSITDDGGARPADVSMGERTVRGARIHRPG
jgi:hypothetical protein